MVNQATWTRTINGTVKESVIDHIYLANPLSISKLTYEWQTFTDHALVIFSLNQDLSRPSTTWKRDWRKYSKDILLAKLQEFDWDLKSDLVQDYWNEFETQLVGVADEIVPYKLFEFKTVVEPIPAMIKHKINERRRLLKSNKHYTTVIKTERIKVLNKDIKSHFNIQKNTYQMTLII